MEVWPIGRLVSWVDGYLAERGVETPRLSAELLVSHVLGCRRIDLYTRWAEPVEAQRRAALRDLVRRAGAHEPIAYLV
ncbi:MAG TPA: peptide chain release factor N(5)-glutamine methyltransferase, partial [Phycisphaerales bacterium]|nr:peptide chain release factor N(5)-glutamine methyltransferase [Phycisphaerales bacterium]